MGNQCTANKLAHKRSLAAARVSAHKPNTAAALQRLLQITLQLRQLALSSDENGWMRRLIGQPRIRRLGGQIRAHLFSRRDGPLKLARADRFGQRSGLGHDVHAQLLRHDAPAHFNLAQCGAAPAAQGQRHDQLPVRVLVKRLQLHLSLGSSLGQVEAPGKLAIGNLTAQRSHHLALKLFASPEQPILEGRAGGEREPLQEGASIQPSRLLHAFACRPAVVWRGRRVT